MTRPVQMITPTDLKHLRRADLRAARFPTLISVSLIAPLPVMLIVQVAANDDVPPAAALRRAA